LNQHELKIPEERSSWEVYTMLTESNKIDENCSLVQ